MTRKLLLLAATITMIFAIPGAGVQDAEAQTTTRCFVEYYNAIVTCPGAPTASANAGGSAGSAAASTGAAGTSTLTTTVTDTTTSLAVTGAESGTLGYVGAGLLGLGSLAAATARRRSRDIS